MNKLYEKLKNYSIEDAIKFEENDRQFIALKKLWESGKLNKSEYLFNIIVNSLICYQLSGKGEDYWEEFSTSPPAPFLQVEGSNNVLDFFKGFLPNSKNNRRFIDTKLKRVEKIIPFLDNFVGKEEYYYENMQKLRDDLAKIMGQKKYAKTIVFAVKMFSYGARNCFDKLIYFPKEISIPVDSRLERIYEKYKIPPSFVTLQSTPFIKGRNNKKNEIKEFYFDLSEKLGIPELHLDAILWNNNEL